ncbi:MAG: KpsF/GutQ family sugar-phosphate isomerase [Bdellovibrionota bacterium]
MNENRLDINKSAQIVEWGRQVCLAEANEISRASKRLSASFFLAVEAILNCSGKVVVTGLGKSGYIARKMASTLSSTGTPSFYLHPAEAMHGDFGMLQPTDCLIAITHGGETREVLGVAKFAKGLKIPVISITGNIESTLSSMSDFSLDGSIEKEADALGLAPTASSTVALALCDALSVAVMKGRGFTSKDFANLHPGGSLGRSFVMVSSHFKDARDLKTVSTSSSFYQIVEAISSPNYGIIAVLDDKARISGAISDGDIRRAILKYGEKAHELLASDLMSLNPFTISIRETVTNAVAKMEQNAVTSLFVMDGSCFAGLLRLHDLITAKII